MQDLNKMINRCELAQGKQVVDLVLKNCQIINVFTHDIHKGHLAISKGKIIGIGDYKGKKEIDIKGQYVAPGFIDSHMHLESTMVTPDQLSKISLANGTTTIIADPHEIANVSGVQGIEYLMGLSEQLPMNIFFMVPSCVPATSFEDAGATIGIKDIKKLLKKEKVLGLGEMMDYPSVIEGRNETIEKIMAAKYHIVDGHGPGLIGKSLNAYMINGIKTDHECTTIEEMHQRLQRGMFVLLREGSAAKDLKKLLPGVNPYNSRRCLFCTDDKNPEDLIKKGHINHNVKIAVENGIDPITAIQMATINAAECYRLRDIGGIAPGYDADLVIFKDLKEFDIQQVYQKGFLVYSDKKILFKSSHVRNSKVLETVTIHDVTVEDFRLKLQNDLAYIISVQRHSLITEKVLRKVNVNDEGYYENHPHLDINKIAVIERHKRTGKVGIGLVENFGLTGGSIATTISHDSHNIVVIGDNDTDMFVAVKQIEKMNGGICIVKQGQVMFKLPLEIAGLMTQAPLTQVHKKLEEMLYYAYNELKVKAHLDPFMTLSFLSLPVIPQIKITPRGLFDTSINQFIDISMKS